MTGVYHWRIRVGEILIKISHQGFLDSRNIAIGILVLSSVALAVAWIVSAPIVLPLFMGLGAVAFLITRSNSEENIKGKLSTEWISYGDKRKVFSILNSSNWLIWVLTFINIGLSILTLLGSFQTYSRPRIFFVFFALYTFSIFLQIVSADLNSRKVRILILFQIILLGLTIVLTNMTVFPYLGSDPWKHSWMAEAVSNEGLGLLPENSYRIFPIYPILNASLLLSVGFSSSGVLITTNLLWALGSILAIYSIGRVLGLIRLSLVSSLLLVTSKWWIYWMNFPSTMGLVAFLIVVFLNLVVKIFVRKESYIDHVILICLIAIAPLVHPFLALGMVFLLICFSIWPTILARLFRSSSYKTQNPMRGYVILALVMTLAIWMIQGSGTFFENFVRQLQLALVEFESLALASSYRNQFQLELDTLSFSILLFWSVIGGLRWIESKDANFTIGVLGASSATFVVISYAGQAAAPQLTLSFRLLLFASLSMVFLASMGVLLFINSKREFALAALFFVAAGFFSFINSENNQDSPFYGEEQTVRMGITEEEHQALEYICDNRSSPLVSDFIFYEIIKLCMEAETTYWRQPEFENIKGYFVFRDLYTSRSWFVGGPGQLTTWDSLESDFLLSKLYDGGIVAIYYRDAILAGEP